MKYKQLKRLLSLLILTFCLCSFQAFFSNEVLADDISIQIDGNYITSDVSPIIVNNRTLVPLRVISENLGASVTWHKDTQSAVIVKGSDVITVSYKTPNSYVVNGIVKSTDAGITISNNRFMVPIRVVSEALGAKVEWKNRTVIITTDGTTTDNSATENSTTDTSNDNTSSSSDSNIIRVIQVDGNVVNLRSGPGTSYSKVGEVYSGNYLEYLEETSGWYKIKTQSGDAAYVAGWLVEKYTASVTNSSPSAPVIVGNNANTSNNSNSNNSTSENTATTISLNGTESIQGQADIALNIQSGTPSVVSNDGNQLILQIDGVTAGALAGNPISSLPSPFTSFSVENYGSNSVRITTTVTENGYFRLDINKQVFTITAVAKHKNGTTGLAGKVIVVSPGHGVYSNGSIDRGAVSSINGLDEVDFNTPVSLKLRDKLEAAGATVIMIRDSEDPIYMTLYQRSVIANENNADAFIEIHGDSAANSSAYGIGTWAYTDDVRLTTEAQEDMRNEFASVMNQALANATGQPAYVKYSNFSVLRETEVPCLLIECGFLSNAADAARLATDSYQEKLAQGIFDGLRNFFAY